MNAKRMSDEELVAEGRKLAARVSAAQLRLGQLALAYAPLGDPSVKSGQYERLEEFAGKIGVEFRTLLKYRTTANAWQGHRVDDMGFKMLTALAVVPAKGTMLSLLRKQEPPNGKAWTVESASALARRHDLWPASEQRDHPGIVLRRTAALHDDIGQLAARFERHEFTVEERELVARQLAEIQAEIERLVAAFGASRMLEAA